MQFYRACTKLISVYAELEYIWTAVRTVNTVVSMDRYYIKRSSYAVQLHLNYYFPNTARSLTTSVMH